MIFAGNVYFRSLLIEQNLQLYCCFYFKNKISLALACLIRDGVDYYLYSWDTTIMWKD